MVYKKRSAKEKLMDSKDLPKIVKIKPNQEKIWGKGRMIIPSPIEVDEIMRNVPMGRVITINKIREKLAKKHKTNTACPICSGIFASISAHAAEEDRLNGKKEITPYWRTLKENGVLNFKYPGGEENQKTLLEKEGHNVIKKGKFYKVENYEKKLVN